MLDVKGVIFILDPNNLSNHRPHSHLRLLLERACSHIHLLKLSREWIIVQSAYQQSFSTGTQSLKEANGAHTAIVDVWKNFVLIGDV